MNVYKECLQTGGGGKPTGGGPVTGTTGGPGSTAAPFSGPTAAALSHAGKDRSVLASVVRNYGLRRTLQASGAPSSATAPSAVGSAFDLGTGPTALLVVLAGTAFLLLGGSGVRYWRQRYRA